MPLIYFCCTLRPPLFASSSSPRCSVSRLQSGITLVLLPVVGAQALAIQAWVAVGSADESPQQAGLSHVMEHMLFRGTGRRKAGEIARDVEAGGGRIDAWTSRDNTVFHVVMPRRSSGVGLDVLADILSSTSFDEDELARECEVIVEEIRQGRDEPASVVAQSMFAGTFLRHPYRNSVLGSEENVSRFRTRDLRSFRERWYHGNNISIVISGDFSVRRMKAHVEKVFSMVPAGRSQRRRRAREHRVVTNSVRLDVGDVRHSLLTLSARLPPIRDRAYPAMDLMSVILGQGDSSILAHELVHKRELCESAYSYVHSLQDYSIAIVGIVADPGNMNEVLPQLGRNLQKMRNEVVSATSLSKARRVIETDAICQCETVEGAARVAGGYLRLVGDPDYERHYLRRIAATSVDELQRVALRFFEPLRMNLTALVPPAESLVEPRGRELAAKSMFAAIERGMRQVTGRGTSSQSPKSKFSVIKKGIEHAPLCWTNSQSKKRETARATTHTLANGMRVIVHPNSSVPMVAACAAWSGGQLLETAGNCGVAELMASVITRGCERMCAEEIRDEVDASASTLVGISGRDIFGIRAEWLTENWRQGIDLLSECLLSPCFDEVEVERSRRRQLSRIAVQRDSSLNRAFLMFRQALFSGHPYGRNTSGTEKSLRKLQASSVKNYYEKNYPISALNLSVVGDVDPESLIARIESRFASVPPRNRPRRPDIAGVVRRKRETQYNAVTSTPSEQCQVVIGFPGVMIGDHDRFAVEVLTATLGGKGGRLFSELRDRLGLAYQVGVVSHIGLEPGYIAVHLSCSANNVDLATGVVRAEIESITRCGIRRDELRRSKRCLIGAHEILYQRRAALASALAVHHANKLSYHQHVSYPQCIEGVETEDIRSAAHRIFNWELAVTVTLVPMTQRNARIRPTLQAKATRKCTV